MKIAAIIQARMRSTRFPEKVMKDILGKPMLQRIIERLTNCQLINEIIIAVAQEKNESLLRLIRECGAKSFIGNAKDVLDRYYQAARKYKAHVIVRITSDCPLIDPEVVDKVVAFYLKNRSTVDYVSNRLKPSYPKGLDIEVFSFRILKKTWQEAKEPYQREHVTPYIYEHPEKHKLHNIEAPPEFHHPRYCWTVDYAEDLEFVRKIYEYLYPKNPNFSTEDIINLLKAKPELIKINVHRGQKLMKSIEVLRDRYKDKEIWILGCGPSFADFPLDFFNNKITIALRPTCAKHLFPNCTFNFCSYTDTWALYFLPEMVKKNPEILKKQIFTLNPDVFRRGNPFDWLGERIGDPFFMPTLKWYSFSDSSGRKVKKKHIEETIRSIMQKKSCKYCGPGFIQGWIIEAALILGAKKITLAGCDCQPPPGKNRYNSEKLDFFYASKWCMRKTKKPNLLPSKNEWPLSQYLEAKRKGWDSLREKQQFLRKILEPYGVELRRFFYKTGYQQIES